MQCKVTQHISIEKTITYETICDDEYTVISVIYHTVLYLQRSVILCSEQKFLCYIGGLTYKIELHLCT